MNLDALTDALKNALDGIFHVEWLSVLVTVCISLAVTAIFAHIVTLLLRKFLSSDATPLPSSSIFINIARVIVWVVGICVIASSCFNIDVSAAITALGVGGIAISLGFQDTLSNLIGGLQLSLTKLVEPGDHIRVGGEEGIVHDVTWRHTSIVTTRGEYVIIPNSVINSEALKKLPKRSPVRIDIIVTPQNDESLTDVTHKIEAAVDASVSQIALLEQKTKIEYMSIVQGGYKGLLSFAVGEGTKVAEVRDAALKAMGDYAHKSPTSQKKTDDLYWLHLGEGGRRLVRAGKPGVSATGATQKQKETGKVKRLAAAKTPDGAKKPASTPDKSAKAPATPDKPAPVAHK